MKLFEIFKKTLGSAIIWFQAIIYFAIILLQMFYPASSWVQMAIVAVIALALLALVIGAGFNTDDAVTKK